MPSSVLEYTRKRYPELANESDKDLTVYIGNRYPSLLGEDQQFASEFGKYTNTPTQLPNEMSGESEHSFLEDFGKSFIASLFYDTGAAGWSVLENVAKPFSEEWEKTFREYADQAQKMGQDLRETGQLMSGLSDAGFDRGVDQDSWGAAFGSGAGSLVPIFATGGAAGAVGLSARAAGVAVYGTIGLQEFGSSYQTARQAYTEQGLENGLSEEEAIDQAGQKAVLPAVSRAAAVMLVTKAGGKVADKIGGTNLEKLASTVGSKNSKEALDILHRGSGVSRWRSVVTGAAVEGGEEAATTYVGDYFIARASYDPDATWQEVSNDAYKAFVVGMGLGGAAGTVQTSGQRKSPEDAAKRDTMRKVAPATAARLDERDSAAARVLPDEAEAAPVAVEAEAAPAEPVTARDKLVKEIEAKGNMPAWWSRYEGTAEPEGTLGPSGLRFADQETVDRFIEDQEAFAELSKMSVKEDADGNFIVSREGEQIDIFESQAEAEAFSRKSAIQRTPKKIRQRIARFKGITKNLRELEQLEAQKKAQLDEMQKPAEQRDVLPEEITEEDKQFVAERLGISPEDLQFSGLRITPEMVSQLRFAPEEGVSEFLRQAEAQRVAQEEAAFFEARQREEEADSLVNEAIDRKIAEIEAEAEIAAQIPRVEADQTEQARAMREGLTPDTNQLSEFAEEQLEGGELTPSARTILNRLLDRKANLIVDSVEAGESQQQNILESITQIDQQIAGLLSDQVRPADTVTPEQLNQLQQSVGAIEPAAPEPLSTLKVGEEEIRITNNFGAIDGVIAPAAAPKVTAEEMTPMMLRQVEEALVKLKKRFGSLLSLSEIKLTKLNGGAGVASLARLGITDSILLDPQRLQKALSNKKFSLEKALEEELIHNLDGQALRAEYARQIANGQLSPTVSLPQFIRNRYTEVANGMTNQERAAARQIYGNEFIDDIHMAQEFVRQLIQQRHTKSVTEDSYRSGPIRRLLALFSRAFQRMNLSAPLKSHVAQVESFLERTYKAEIADADTAAAKQRLKDERAARQAEKKQRKQAKRDAADKLENDHAEAYEKIQKAIARNPIFETTSNNYQLAVDKAYDAWRKMYEKGEAVSFTILAKNAIGRVLAENKAQKRGSGQVDSLDKLYEEGFNPSVEFTLAGQKTLDIISAKKDEIGLVDNELKYLHYFLGGEPSQQVMAAEMNISEGRVSQIKKKAIQKLQNYSLNNPSFASALIDSATNPNDLITAAAAVGAADPNIGKNRVAGLVAAQRKYQSSERTRADWEELNQAIEKYSKIIEAVPLPTKDSLLTEAEIIEAFELSGNAQKKNQLKKYKDHIAAKKKGQQAIKIGDEVDVRVDIDAYVATRDKLGDGRYILAFHGRGIGKNSGFESFVHLGPELKTGSVQLVTYSDKRMEAIAAGEKAKTPLAAVRGSVISFDTIPDLTGWTQVGMNPERHSYFYNRANPSMMVVSGSEAISIGNTVFVKDAVMEDAFDARVAFAADPNAQPTTPPSNAETSSDKWSPDRKDWMKTPDEVGAVKSVKGVIAAAMENTFDDQVGNEQKFGLGREDEIYTSFEEFYGGVLGTARDGLESISRGFNRKFTTKDRAAYDWLQKEIDNPHPQNWGESWLEWNKRFLANQQQSDAGVAYAAKPSETDPHLLSDPAVRGSWSILTTLGDFKKKVFRFFDSSGGLRMPSVMNADKQLDFFQKKIEKDAYINSVMGEVRASNRRLQKAAKREFGKEPTPEQVAMMNNALAGDSDAIGKLPDEIRDLLAEMRQQIDGLSKHIVNKGWVTGDLKAKIEGNLETYLARSYRIFDDPEYIDNIEPEVINKAINFVEKQLLKNGADPMTAQQQARIEVDDMLAKYSQKGGRESLNAGRLGEKDLSLFMKRKDIAPEIRALLGEYKDPVMNYTRSVTRMAHFVANHKFLTDIKNMGLGEVFFEEKDLRRSDLKANTKIAGTVAGVKVKEGEEDVSRGSYSPLAGLYTTKEVNDILNEYNTMSSIMSDGLMGSIAKYNVLSKSTKTVMSVMTHVRNAMGQIPFSIMNGHNPFAYKKAYKAFQAIFADASGVGLAKGGKEARDRAARAAQAYFNKMTRLGLVGEEMTTAELQRVLSDSQAYLDSATNAEEFLNKATGGMLDKAKKAGRVSFETLTRIYRASDELGKIMNFEMEKEQLRPLYPELTEAELETLAAQRTRGGVPTYSEMPPAIQRLRMQPFVGPFMSFFYEAIRTQINNVRYAGIEMKRGNTAYAARRIGGHLAVTGVMSYALKAISEMIGGVSEEEQEDVRTLLADYEKDSQFYFYRDEDKQVKYVNISFNNPYAATTDPIMSALGLNGIQEEGIAPNLISKMIGMMQPFTSETIVAQSVIDITRNTTQYGSQVYNEEASDFDQTLDSVLHIARSFTPGTADRIVRRMIPAGKGETLPSGEDPKLTDELTAEFTGFRVRTIDYQDKLTRTSFGTSKRFTDANGMFNKVAGSRGTVSNEDMVNAYREANEARLRIFKEVRKQINAALLSGVSKAEVFTALKAGNLSKTDVQHIMRGQYRPMDISESVARRARQANHPIPRREVMEIKREYLRKPLDDEGSE